MRKHARNRVRSRGKRVLHAETRLVPYFGYAQISESWRDWSFRTVSLKKALELERDGEAQAISRMVDGFVRVVGFRARKPIRVDRPSPTTLTLATMVAVGNNQAQAELTPAERRHIEKFQVWALIGDDRACAVRPKISEQERRVAMRLLGRGQRTQVHMLCGMLGAA